MQSVRLFGATFFALAQLLATPLIANSIPQHGPTEAKRAFMEQHNSIHQSEIAQPDEAVARPFAEYEETGYVLMSAVDGWESMNVKRAIAQHLPTGVDLVIFTQGQNEHNIRNFFRPYLASSRLHIAPVGGKAGDSFWARDNLPVPVFLEGNELGLVDAKYHHSYEPDRAIARYFNVPLLSHNLYYEGGNFVADTQGNCMAVNPRVNEATFKSHYGCKKITKFPRVGGIGHVDERVKLLSDKVALTDTESFVKTLEGLGYEVHKLPRGQGYETYVNSLLIHDTVFLPIYGRSNDQKAISTYQKMGLKVVPVRTNNMSNKGLGSIHCITMTYPKVNLDELISKLRHVLG